MINATCKWIDEKSLPSKWRPGGAERELFEILVLKNQATSRAKGSIHFSKIMPESRPKKSSGNFIRKLAPWEYMRPRFPEMPKKVLPVPPKLICKDADGNLIRLKEFLANKIRDAVAKVFGSEPKAFVQWPWRFSKIETNSKEEGSMTVKAKDGRTLSLNEALAEAIRAQVRLESHVRRLTVHIPDQFIAGFAAQVNRTAQGGSELNDHRSGS